MAINTAGFDDPPTRISMSPFARDRADADAQSPEEYGDEQRHVEEYATMDHDDTSGQAFEVKEQDRSVPIANVARIMKAALPDNAKISKEAKECMQECVSEFIAFITSEAVEKCRQEKRKTVSGEDILFALASLGFENYAELLKIYFMRYRETPVARGEQQKPNVASSSGPAGAVEDHNDAKNSSCD
jgi:histone H3/H4